MPSNIPYSSDYTEENENIKYPKAIFFIVINEFCERFCFYGMKTVLSLYMVNVLKYDEKTSTVLFHIWAGLSYFFPLFGGIIADTFFGKFRTIVYLSCVYLTGNVVVSVTSVDPLHIPKRELTIVGLLLVAIGTGGIKPCVSSFGGDQFVLPEQAKQLATFFSVFYFAINTGSLLSTFVTPIFRNDVKCFGQNECFPLAFGVPAMLMMLAIIVFLCGRPLYKFVKPAGNVVVDCTKCICHAVKRKFKVPKTERTKSHWLDYAEDKYSGDLIRDIKVLLSILLLFLPLPLFWALFDQQGSRWTFQANRMDGKIYGNIDIHPDQMQLINPLLILTFIPLFQYAVYPLIEKCGVRTPLRKLFVGGQLAAVAFVVSALVEFQIRARCNNLSKKRHFSLRIYNSMDCDFTFYSSLNNNKEKVLKSFDMLALDNIPINGTQNFSTMFKPSGSCPYVLNKSFESIVFGSEGKMTEYSLLTDTKQQAHLRRLGEYQGLMNQNSSVKLQILYGPDMQGKHISFQSHDGFHRTVKLPVDLFHTEYIDNIPAGFYQVEMEKNILGTNMKLKDEGVYVLNLHGRSQNKTVRLLETKCTDRIHMVWLVPQYVIITAGEVMFSIPGLEFAFTQAPLRMKSVISACWLLTTAFGNLIVAVVAGAKIFENQGYEFLLFAGLMMLDMFVFAFLAYRYKYSVPDEDPDDDTDFPATFSRRPKPGEPPTPAGPKDK